MICKRCSFDTERMLVREWHAMPDYGPRAQGLAACVAAMLTPPVTRSLPEEWQGTYTLERASKWIEERDRDGTTLLVVERKSGLAIGLVILFETEDGQSGTRVRLGYLLSESAWGRGLASELVRGFVGWCSTADVSLIVAGVERDNPASQRVLEKSGFKVVPDASDTANLMYERGLR